MVDPTKYIPRQSEPYGDLERLRAFVKKSGAIQLFIKTIDPSTSNSDLATDITTRVTGNIGTDEINNVKYTKMLALLMNASINFLEAVRDNGFPSTLETADSSYEVFGNGGSVNGLDLFLLFKNGLFGDKITEGSHGRYLSNADTAIDGFDNVGNDFEPKDLLKRWLYLLGMGAVPVPGSDKIAGDNKARTRVQWMQMQERIKYLVDYIFLSIVQSDIFGIMVARLSSKGIPDSIEIASAQAHEAFRYLLGETPIQDLSQNFLAIDKNFFDGVDLDIDALRAVRQNQTNTFWVHKKAVEHAMSDFGHGEGSIVGGTVNYANLLRIGVEQDITTSGFKVGYGLNLAVKYFQTYSALWKDAWAAIVDQEHWQYKQFLTFESANLTTFDLGQMNGIMGANRYLATLDTHLVSARTMSAQMVTDNATPIQREWTDSLLKDLMSYTEDDVSYLYARDASMFQDDEVLGYLLRMQALFYLKGYAHSSGGTAFHVLQGIGHMHLRTDNFINYVYQEFLSGGSGTPVDKASAMSLLEERNDSPLNQSISYDIIDYTDPAAALTNGTQEVEANLPNDQYELPHVEQLYKKDVVNQMLHLVFPNAYIAGKPGDSEDSMHNKKENSEKEGMAKKQPVPPKVKMASGAPKNAPDSNTPGDEDDDE